jgi:hypothetical protein
MRLSAGPELRATRCYTGGDDFLAWRERQPARMHRYRVTVDDDHVSWQGKEGSGVALLRGGVGSSFLKQP